MPIRYDQRRCTRMMLESHGARRRYYARCTRTCMRRSTFFLTHHQCSRRGNEELHVDSSRRAHLIRCVYVIKKICAPLLWSIYILVYYVISLLWCGLRAFDWCWEPDGVSSPKMDRYSEIRQPGAPSNTHFTFRAQGSMYVVARIPTRYLYKRRVRCLEAQIHP